MPMYIYLLKKLLHVGAIWTEGGYDKNANAVYMMCLIGRLTKYQEFINIYMLHLGIA